MRKYEGGRKGSRRAEEEEDLLLRLSEDILLSKFTGFDELFIGTVASITNVVFGKDGERYRWRQHEPCSDSVDPPPDM